MSRRKDVDEWVLVADKLGNMGHLVNREGESPESPTASEEMPPTPET